MCQLSLTDTGRGGWPRLGFGRYAFLLSGDQSLERPRLRDCWFHKYQGSVNIKGSFMLLFEVVNNWQDVTNVCIHNRLQLGCWFYCQRSLVLMLFYCQRSLVLMLFYCQRSLVLMLFYCQRSLVLMLFYCQRSLVLMLFYCQRSLVLMLFYCQRSLVLMLSCCLAAEKDRRWEE